MIHLQTEYNFAVVRVTGSGDDLKIAFSYDSFATSDPADFRGGRCAINYHGEVFYPLECKSRISNLEVVAEAMRGRVKLADEGSYLIEDANTGKTRFHGFPRHA